MSRAEREGAVQSGAPLPPIRARAIPWRMPDVAAPHPFPPETAGVPAAEAHVRAGHPWVYESSLRAQNRDGEAGELAVIYDRRDRFLAIGLFDPDSPLRVRVLHQGTPPRWTTRGGPRDWTRRCCAARRCSARTPTGTAS